MPDGNILFGFVPFKSFFFFFQYAQTLFLKDLWTHTDNGTVVRNFTARAVPPHAVVALLLTDDGDEPEGTQPPCARREWCTDEDGTVI